MIDSTLAVKLIPSLWKKSISNLVIAKTGGGTGGSLYHSQDRGTGEALKHVLHLISEVNKFNCLFTALAYGKKSLKSTFSKGKQN